MSDIYRLVERPNELTGGTITVAETFSGHYIGEPARAAYLCDERGIWPELQEPQHNVCSIGFCPSENKWYGWSHRALYGFGIGSTVKRGDCGYVADTVDGLYEDYIAFFSDVTDPKKIAAKLKRDYDNKRLWVGEEHYSAPIVSSLDGLKVAMDHPELIPEGTITMGGYWINVGRGAWTAETLDDARQMACDFAEAVS